MKEPKTTTSVSERKAQMARFEYKGVSIYKLTPVTKIKDLREQITEIEERLEAMARYCDENSLVMTPLHMMNALGLIAETYDTMLRGKARGNTANGAPSDKYDVELSKTKKDEEIALIKERSQLLKHWETACNQHCLDTVARDNQFGRSIYLSKAVFHNWDTPQATGTVDSSIEIVLGKANRIKLKLEQEAKAKKKEEKGDEAW